MQGDVDQAAWTFAKSRLRRPTSGGQCLLARSTTKKIDGIFGRSKLGLKLLYERDTRKKVKGVIKWWGRLQVNRPLPYFAKPLCLAKQGVHN